MIPFLYGFHINVTQGNGFDIRPIAKFVDPATVAVNYSTSVKGWIQSAHISLVIIDLSVLTMHGDISYTTGFATYYNRVISRCYQIFDPADGALFFGINSINILNPTTTGNQYTVDAVALITAKFLDPNVYSLNVSMLYLRGRYCAAPYDNYFLNLYDGYCYESCPELTKAHLLPNYCYRCHGSCLDCNDSLPENCTACEAEQFLEAGRCVCPLNTGKNQQWKCIQCEPQCSFCDLLPYNCTACAPGWIMNRDGKCVCPDLMLNSKSSCLSCLQLFEGCDNCTWSQCTFCSVANNFEMKSEGCACKPL